MICFFCKDPAAHPATGSELAPGVLACASCERHFYAWFIPFADGNGRRRGGPNFYAHVAPVVR